MVKIHRIHFASFSLAVGVTRGSTTRRPGVSRWLPIFRSIASQPNRQLAGVPLASSAGPCCSIRKMNGSQRKAILAPLASSKFVMDRAKDVSICSNGVEHVAELVYNAFVSGQLSLKNFKQCDMHPKEAREIAINWIFLADTLNFSFWSGDTVSSNGATKVPKWSVEFHGHEYTGYFALCAGINRAIEEGIDILNPSVFGSLIEADILRIFRSSTPTEIPMVPERVKNLQEASRVLLEKYDGSFVNCVKDAEHSAQLLLTTIVTYFKSYADENEFEGRQVSFHKRAQILIGDIWACFEGKGLGRFDDISTLTMFADYRIPQVLVHFGALQYSKELYEKLEKDLILKNGDRLEIEIRAGSILAVDRICEEVTMKIYERRPAISGFPQQINSILIDHFLWDYRRENVELLDKIPYHKVRCIYY